MTSNPRFDEILNRLTSVFRVVLGQPNLMLEAATNAKTISGWDSMNHVQLIIAVEKEFQMKFSAIEVSRARNVGDLAALIEKKQLKKPA